MPTEFSLFSALPTELREEIWNLAIRPKRSGVHIFRVYSTYMDHETSPEEVIHFSANGASFYGHERCELSLAVPLPRKSLDGANKDGARMTSSYMIDTGLWTACHESRSMMKKAFPTIKNTRHGKVYISKLVMCYYHSGGARFYFTMRPMSDLFILRPDSPYYHLYNVDDALGHKVLHVGIEYQSDWGPQFYDELQGDGECPAFDQIQGLQHNVFAPCIWRVDHNLKRKANAPPHEAYRCGFSWKKALRTTGSTLNQFRMETTTNPQSTSRKCYMEASSMRKRSGLKLCSTLQWDF
ncbi:hypothetical protein BKA60DRAFT_647354 [Fusarium oxysporum]|nr:hypothetical protein BKA60DRAFT_647354 [Fusarium oxysporum]